MKKRIPILFVFVGCVMIILGFTTSLYESAPKDAVKYEEETDSRCINAFSNNDYLLRTVTVDDVSIEFNFLNCDLKEKNEDGKYYLFSPENGFSIETFLNSSSPGSTAFEIYDTYVASDEYFGKNITMKSGSTEDGILYRIISVFPSKDIYDNKDIYHEYIIVYTVEAGKSVVLKAKVNNEGDTSLLFETIFNSFKIIKLKGND